MSHRDSGFLLILLLCFRDFADVLTNLNAFKLVILWRVKEQICFVDERQNIFKMLQQILSLTWQF